MYRFRLTGTHATIPIREIGALLQLRTGYYRPATTTYRILVAR